jgi:hypothetical protein
MAVSSRTPEGSPNHCPICKQPVCVEPSIRFGDAPCPNCGCLLWFIATNTATRFFLFDESAAVRERVASTAAGILGIDENTVGANPNFWNDLGPDSLDVAELVMELESEFG